MTQKTLSVDRQEVLDLALVAVEKASRNGRVIAATLVAQDLLDAHPDCEVTLAELQDQIARFALAANVGVEFGLPPLHRS